MTAAAVMLTPARLRPADLARLASIGVRTRRLRSALSALGIAIGVARDRRCARHLLLKPGRPA